jgi:hypothetical protein
MQAIYFLVDHYGEHLYNRVVNTEEALYRVMLKNKGSYGVRYEFDAQGDAFPVRGYYYVSMDMALIYITGITPWEV